MKVFLKVLYLIKGIILLWEQNFPSHKHPFSVATPTIWNGIPIDIRQAPTVQSFKRHLKTYYFKSVFIKSRDYPRFRFVLVTDFLARYKCDSIIMIITLNNVNIVLSLGKTTGF